MTAPVFVDTSALYAIHDTDDARHRDAASDWSRLLDAVAEGDAAARTHSGVIVETSALVQRRLGIEALRALHNLTLPVLDVTWIDAATHDRAVGALLGAARREVSLVDWTSFEVMRAQHIEHALAYDDDFAEQGFRPW